MITNPKAQPRKAWGMGPELTIISQNLVNGGGPANSYFELTGQRAGFHPKGGGLKTANVPLIFYTNIASHS